MLRTLLRCLFAAMIETEVRELRARVARLEASLREERLSAEMLSRMLSASVLHCDRLEDQLTRFGLRREARPS